MLRLHYHVSRDLTLSKEFHRHTKPPDMGGSAIIISPMLLSCASQYS